MNNSREIAEALKYASKVTVLTGAGVSTDVGIPDFKSTDASWGFEQPREVLLSAPFWRRNPERFWEVYRATLGATTFRENVEPGAFHRWTAELERKSESKLRSAVVLTQNVDGLHSKAGSGIVYEAHGNSSRAICLECKKTFPIETLVDHGLPFCDECNDSVLKPDVSLFGEGVNGIGEFRQAIDRSDLLIVAGTSLNVGPVNELPYYAQFNRFIPTLWVSNDPPPDIYSFSYEWIGPIKDFTRSFELA